MNPAESLDATSPVELIQPDERMTKVRRRGRRLEQISTISRKSVGTANAAAHHRTEKALQRAIVYGLIIRQ